jgi:hypothetical protein
MEPFEATTALVPRVSAFHAPHHLRLTAELGHRSSWTGLVSAQPPGPCFLGYAR